MSDIVIKESEFSKRSDLHIQRKLWHMGMGSMFLIGYYNNAFTLKEAALFSIIISIAGFSLDFFRVRNEWLNRIVVTLFRPFMRKEEINGVSGLPFFALGCAISCYFFKPYIAALSVFFLVFADPIASTVGILYGKGKILPNKSLQGALAAFFTCAVITYVFCKMNGVIPSSIFIYALLAGVIGSLSELMSVWIDDNFSIPVFSGLGLTVLHYFFF